MFNLISLLITAALVSLQYGFVANAQLETSKIDIDMQNSVLPTPRKRLRNFIHISQPLPEGVRNPEVPLELTCSAMGAPAPTIHWLRNGEPIQKFDMNNNEIVPVHSSSIGHLTSTLVMTSPANGDVITCVATSGQKQISSYTNIYSDAENSEKLLLQKLLAYPTKPTITEYYNEAIQEMGTDLVLPCRVHSFGKSQVYWQDVNGDLIYGDERIRTLPTGDLLISALRWSDMGEYNCVAKNMYGKQSINTFVYPLKV